MPAVIVDPSRAIGRGWEPRWSFSDGIAAVWQEWSAAGRSKGRSACLERQDDRSPIPASEVEPRAKSKPEERDAASAFLAAHPPGVGAPLAVVIPAYNEEPTVAEVIGEIPAQAAGLATEVIVVVDGAKDATAAKATTAGALVCDVTVNRGQGAALRLGYWLARTRGAQVIATIDADGQYDPEELAKVVQPILDDKADFVSGSRRLGQRADHRQGAPCRA